MNTLRDPLIVAAAIRTILLMELLAFQVPRTLSSAIIVIWLLMLDQENLIVPPRGKRGNRLVKTLSDSVHHLSSSGVTRQPNPISLLALYAHVGKDVKHLPLGGVAPRRLFQILAHKKASLSA